jgi:hypothetical protein
MGKRAILAAPGPTPGSFRTWIGPAPDYSAGDAQFFDDDPARHVQLRPILRHEQRPGRFYGPSDLMLICKGVGLKELRIFVRMKPGHRENTPGNVERAIQQVEKFDASIGAAFRMALSGRDPFAEIEQTNR